ncbi:Hemerythrin HHE cation binding protein, partial [human gut metagenome]
KGELDKIKTKIEPGHVVHTLIAEHDRILEFLTELEDINFKIQKLNSYDNSLEEFETISKASFLKLSVTPTSFNFCKTSVNFSIFLLS